MSENKERELRLVSLSTPSSGLGVESATHPAFDIKSLKVSGPPWQAAYEEYARSGKYVEAEVPLQVPVRRLSPAPSAGERRRNGTCRGTRSEEHTSELQSPDHLVCRLLLEKKK